MGIREVLIIAGPSLKSVIGLLTVLTIVVSHTEQAINVPQDVGPVSLPTTSEFSCVNRTLGSYYPDYKSNCQKFHLCATGEEGEVLNLSFLCPEGAAFDDRASDCLPVENAQCNANITESTSVRSTRRAQIQELRDVSSTTNTNFKTTFKCRGKKLGSYHADPETGCRLFHLCTPGSTKTELLDFQFLCLAGTLFDESSQRCTEDPKTTCGGIKHLKKQIQPIKPNDEVQLNLNDTLSETEATQTEFIIAEEPLFDASSALLRKKREEPVKVERIWKISTDVKRRSKRAPPPSFDLDSLPQTSFTCAGKVIGGYYADIEAGCQMYHVCSQGPDGRVQNFKFLCINGTIFSQQTRTCQTWYTVDCASTQQFFALNEELSRVTEDPFGANAGISQQQSPQISQNSIQRQRPQQQQQQQEVHPQFIFQDNFAIHDSGPQEPQLQQQTLVETATPSPPQFQGRFQAITEAQQILVVTEATVPPRTTGERKRGRGGRRRRPKTRKRVQQPTTSLDIGTTISSIPTSVAIIDDGRIGFQQQSTGSLQQQNVHGQFTQESIFPDVQRTSSVQRQNVQQGQISQENLFPDVQRTSSVQRQNVQQGQITQDSLFPDLQSQVLLEDVQRTSGVQIESVQQPRQQVQQPRQEQQQQVLVQSSRQQGHQQERPVAARQQSQSLSSGRVPVAPVQSTGGEIFAGFDAFINAAIEDEQRQRQVFKIEQEQKRLRGELDPPVVEEQIQVATQASVRPSRRRRPTEGTPPITTAVPTGVPQIPFRTDTFQGIGADVPVVTRAPPPSVPFRTDIFQSPSVNQQSPQTISEIPSTVSIQPSALPQLQQIPLFESTTTTHRKPVRRPQFQQLSAAPPPSVNLDELLLQQLSQRPQHLPQRQQSAPSQVTPQQNVNLDALLLHQLSSRPPQQTHTTASLPLQTPTWHNPNLDSILLQQPSRPTVAQVPTTSGINLNNVLLQPMPVQPQPPGFSGVSDVFFLVPSESQLSRAALQQHRPMGALGLQLRQRRAVPRTSTPPSQFLDSDVPRLVPKQRQITVETLLPITSFSCKGKVTGGYYADVETGCKMFHICSSGRSRSLLYDFRFLCGNETLFDQRSQTCSTPEKVKCETSSAYYPKHPLPEESFDAPVPNSELLRIRIKRAVPGAIKVNPSVIAQTTFSCEGRENGRYYADAQSNCQFFHLCAEVSPGGWLKDTSFLCPNGTVFDQRAQACDDQTDALNCIEDPPHYGIDEVFARIP